MSLALNIPVRAPVGGLLRDLRESGGAFERFSSSVKEQSAEVGAAFSARSIAAGARSGGGGGGSQLASALGMAAVARQAKYIGEILRKSMLAAVPILADIRKRMTAVAEVAGEFRNKAFDRRLARSLETATNPLVKGFLQAVRLSRQLSDNVEFASSAARRLVSPLAIFRGGAGRFGLPEGPKTPRLDIGGAAMVAGGTMAASRAAGGIGSGIKGALKGTALVAGGAALAGLTAATAGFMASARAASDLNEQLDRAQIVFGPAVGTITRDADKLATQFGIVRREYIQGAAELGPLLAPLGKGQQETAALSSKLTTLAAQLSSTTNIPFPEALDKIRSGLSGESEPLRRFGVDLRDAALQAEAVRLGIVKQNQELTAAGKTATAVEIMFRQLSYTNNNLEMTAGSVANQTRKLWGTLENFGASAGQALEPLTSGFISLANDGLALAVGWFDRNREAVSVWADISMRMGAMVRATVLDWAGAVYQSAAGPVSSAFQWIVSGLGLVVDSFGYLPAAWYQVRGTLLDGLASIAEGVASVGRQVAELLGAVGIEFTFATAFADDLRRAADEAHAVGRELAGGKALTEKFAEQFAKIRRDAEAAAAATKAPAKAIADQAGKAKGPETPAKLAEDKKGKKKDALGLTDAVAAGSAEWTAAILRARTLGSSGSQGEAVKVTAKATRRTVELLGTTNRTLGQVKDKLASRNTVMVAV